MLEHSSRIKIRTIIPLPLSKSKWPTSQSPGAEAMLVRPLLRFSRTTPPIKGSSSVERYPFKITPDHQFNLTLSKKVQDEAVGLPVIAADYTSVESLRETLEKHQIHTVISALQMDGPCMRSQFNLIKAASASSVTKRFIPSSYFVYPLREYAWPPNRRTPVKALTL